MISDGSMQEFECAISIDRHFIQQPIALSCGHHICKRCMPKDLSVVFSVTCSICKVVTTKDIRNDLESSLFKKAFQFSMNELFEVLEGSFAKSINCLKETMTNAQNGIDLKIKFIKEEIEIRVESLKAELDEINGKFQKYLDRLALESCNKTLSKFENDYSNFEKELDSFRVEVKNNRNEETFYSYQSKLQKLNELIETVNQTSGENEMTFERAQETAVLNSEMIIGKLINNGTLLNTFVLKANASLLYDQRESLERVSSFFQLNKHTSLDLGVKTWCIYLLPNGNILTSNYYSLSIYDKSFELQKRVSIFENSSFYCNDVAVNQKEKVVYFGDHQNNRIFIADLDLNLIKCLKSKAYLPHGIEFYAEKLYVCDFTSQAVQVLSTELVVEKRFRLDYQPFQIKIVDNTAIVRPNQFNNLNSVFVYDASTFTLKCSYSGHKGTLSVLGTNVYEYCFDKKKLYCYSNQGLQLREIDIELDELSKCRFNGAMAFIDDQLVVTSDSPQKVYFMKF